VSTLLVATTVARASERFPSFVLVVGLAVVGLFVVVPTGAYCPVMYFTRFVVLHNYGIQRFRGFCTLITRFRLVLKHL